MRNTTYITALLITTTFSSFSQKETTKKYSKQSEPTVIEAPKEEGYQMGDHDPVPPSPPVESTSKQEDTYMIVDESPSFVGGMVQMNQYFAKNMKYPERAIKEEIQGKVYIKFVVEEDGTPTQVKLMKGITDCPECDVEAVRLIKQMPKWEPGKINGKAVKCYYTIPVTFKLM
ncbi:energy transducer TonB [Crocinitomicaceae bacterium CZZ-1]|uniref:Energy transducer TonB n=1 Tax=Taishania pollutisoli TaxID=2766479 RepID=A0A8J6PFD6_9FLAO|nr:energy transducer TonB [Taishania pollutisoli]MBC9813483.1 energy transducer TonB [Taishania pollutisoli]